MILYKVHAAVFCIIAATFAALFIYITGRRAFERDVIGTLFAAGLCLGLCWATFRAWRRWKRL